MIVPGSGFVIWPASFSGCAPGMTSYFGLDNWEISQPSLVEWQTSSTCGGVTQVPPGFQSIFPASEIVLIPKEPISSLSLVDAVRVSFTVGSTAENSYSNFGRISYSDAECDTFMDPSLPDGNYVADFSLASWLPNSHIVLAIGGEDTPVRITGVCLAVSIGDPYWDSVVLAMHMDDYGDVKGHTITQTGDPVVSAEVSKFGSSILFDYSDYLSAPYSSEFNIGTSDFTIDGWVHWSAGSGAARTFFSLINSSSNSWASRLFIGKSNSDKLLAAVYSGSGVNYAIESSSVLPSAEFVHFEFNRNGSTYRLFQNGIQVGSMSPPMIAHDHTGITIGNAYPGAAGWQGYLEDIRFTIGVARHTSAFEPPLLAFPNA